MKITGTATLQAPVTSVFDALNDPAVLVRTIPGCQQLEQVGPDNYRMTVYAGVASVKGTYQGAVTLLDQRAPDSFRLKASGAGAPGTVDADVLVTLTESPDGLTLLEYHADAVVGGMVGGVGQRMLTGVAKKTASEFFNSVDVLLNSEESQPVRDEPTTAQSTAKGAETAANDAGRTVFSAPAATRKADSGDFMTGVAVGAVVALLGVLVGSRLRRASGCR